MLPLKNIDLTIVAIGENFGASIKTVGQLRRMGVRKIYARAIDELHESILEGLKVDRILNPEQRAALDLVNEIEMGTKVESMRVDSDSYIMQSPAPEYFFQMKYSELPASLHGLRLITAARPTMSENILGIDRNKLQVISPESLPAERVQPGDVLTLFGTAREFKALFRMLG